MDEHIQTIDNALNEIELALDNLEDLTAEERGIYLAPPTLDLLLDKAERAIARLQQLRDAVEEDAAE